MSMLVTNGSLCACTFGMAPCPLVVLPTNRVMSGAPAANIMDNKPFVNLATFGMCTTPSNPAVAAATAAALGVLTPMPCIPVFPAPWAPGSPTVLINNLPALTNASKLMCMWGGVVSVTAPAQFTTMIP